MTYKQNIPWYKNEYLNQEWERDESSHYVFYSKKESLAKQNLNNIIALKENHYSKIVQWLGIDNNKKINYYLYSSIKEKLALMGDNSPGNAIWEELDVNNNPRKTEIHAVYNEKCKFIGEHEDTHLLSLPWGLSIYLFCEGLAQYMEDNFIDEDLHVITKKLLQENKLYAVDFLCTNNNWVEVVPTIIYPQVGSFIKYLIEIHGKEKFQELYQNTSRNYDTPKNLLEIEKIYKKNAKELETEWKKLISQPTFASQNQK